MENQQFQNSFEEVAKTYESVRPGYPEQMYLDISRICGINSGVNILELGAGSGIASVELVKMSNNLTLLEPGKKLLEIAKKRLSNHDNINCIQDTFENFECKDRKFDLIVSATAFHWLDIDTKYQRSSYFLKDDGYLVLCWNSFCNSDMEVFNKLNNLRDIIEGRETFDYDVNQGVIKKCIKREIEIINNPEFYLVESKRYRKLYKYDSQTYAMLLETFPEIEKMDEGVRNNYLETVKEIIKESGDEIYVPILTSLYVLQKKKYFSNYIGNVNISK